EVPGEIAGRSRSAGESGAGSRQQEENRCAQVRDPTSEKERGGGGGEVGWIRAKRPEEVAGVVERHDDHDDAAQHVHRLDPFPALSLRHGLSAGLRQRYPGVRLASPMAAISLPRRAMSTYAGVVGGNPPVA